MQRALLAAAIANNYNEPCAMRFGDVTGRSLYSKMRTIRYWIVDGRGQNKKVGSEH